MNDQKYDSNTDYSGKWCLYQTSYISPIICIFVIEKKNGFIKYIHEKTPSDIEYSEESYFVNCKMFTISPFNTELPNCVKKKDTEIANQSTIPSSTINCNFDLSTCRYGRTEEDYRDCQHYKNGYCRCCILTSDPPQYEACSFRNDLPDYEYCGKVDFNN